MQHLSVHLEKACVAVLDMYHITKNTGLDDIKGGEIQIVHQLCAG